jgi:beta-lactamase regulating signal transducer with metallopeptidase domain
MSQSLMSAWLFDSLLVTSLLMATILLIRRPVAKIFGAGVAYALWLIPAARLLMPSLAGEVAPIGESSQAVRDAVRESILTGVTTGDPVAAVAAAPSIDLAALAITLWLGGAMLFFIVQMIRYASMRDDLLADAEVIDVIDGVRVVASDQVAGPLAFGLFKRFIAMPQNFTKAYSPAERELAIAHEMAHHKSGDLFANMAAFVVLCLMWFNPLAWISWSAFRFDQEAACDARVLSGKGAEEREIYGRALARTAFDGVPTFATALNSPKTIIERLRRLTMKDASKQRRSLGKLGILTAAAVILPLTATIVPSVTAQDEQTTGDAKPQIVKKVKIIKIDNDGKTVDVVGHDGDSKEVTKIERDGKTFIFRTDKKLSEEEVEKMIERAEESRADAEDALADATEARAKAEVTRDHAEVARGHAEAMRVHAVAIASSYVPDIDISEITKDCKVGEPVTTDVSGFDGQRKARIKIVMCGKGHARIARVEALSGLREARSEIADDKDMPAGVRKDVTEKLEEQIRKLEAEADTPG